MEVENNILYGFQWAVFVMMFDLSTDRGHIFNAYYLLIHKLKKRMDWLFKILGGCPVCFGIWFSVPAYYLLGGTNYFTFIAVSQFILILRYVNKD